MALPPGIETGTVTWTVNAIEPDIQGDSDRLPELAPIGGSLLFRPSRRSVRLIDPPPYVTYFLEDVRAYLDEFGVLRDDDGEVGVVLVSPFSSGLAEQGWTWEVLFSLEGGHTFESFSFQIQPDETKDLTELTPVDSSPGTITVMGPPGLDASVTVGSTTTTAPGGTANVTNSGTAQEVVLDFVLPRGDTGPTGASGTIESSTATGLAAGAAPTVTLGGTPSARTIAFGIPKGDKGDKGDTGDQGPIGAGAPDATTTSKGSILLAGDLGGTAAAPTVTGGTNHTHTAAQISNSTAVGRSVLTAVDATAARTAIGAGTGSSNLAIGTTSTTAKAGDYQPTAANISDSTAVGRSVLTAADAAAARTAIGAGTSNLALGSGSSQAAPGDHTHVATAITDSTPTGRSVLVAADAAAARTAIGAGTGNSNLAIGTTSTTAKAGDYQPAAANISDSSTVGRSVLTAANAAAARTAIGAGTGNGNVTGTGITAIVQITQSAYTALGTKDPDTLYVIVG